MSTFNALPEVLLSKNGAKYLLIRNASEKELFKKQTWLLDKAKSKEERAFCREKERLLQRRLSRLQEVGQKSPSSDESVKKISEDESDKWEVQSDTPCYIRHRRKQGVFLDSSPLWSSQDSVCPSSWASMSQRGPGAQNCDGLASSPNVVRKFRRAISEQNSSTSPHSSMQTSSPRSSSCVLPPISLHLRSVSLNEGERKIANDHKQGTRERVSFEGS